MLLDPHTSSACVVARGWPGRLVLGFDREAERTVLRRKRHEGPLLVQRPFFPEGESVAHVYILNPPGGIVGGDKLELEVEATGGAHAVLTTPAATKVYRSGGHPARLSQRFVVHEGAALEWFPQETILFDGADVALSTRIELAEGAKFIGWEISCFGRPAASLGFDTGRVRQHFEVWRGDDPLLIERSCLQGGTAFQQEPWGFGGHPVAGSFVCTTRDPDALRRAREALPRAEGSSGFVAATQLRDVVVCRYLGDSAESARRVFVRVWSALRPLALGRVACLPRVWAT